jgi:hypothetical protein
MVPLMWERRAVLILLIVLSSVLVTFPNIATVKANPIPFYLLEMTEEYINYTISYVNGSLWAKVDGTYPLTKFDIECQNQLTGIDNTCFTFTGDTQSLVYPTPPGTTSITIKVDETELEWSNYTQTFPCALHKTAIGDWPMISCTIHPVLDQFRLKIHYEHPIIQNNESYAFLYDVNISPYLSPWSTKSTAHFNIRFETKIKDLKVYTIATDGSTNPVDYTVKKEDAAETVSLQVISEYSKPLPGDLLISFIEEKEIETTSSSFFASNLSTEQIYAILGMTVLSTVVVVGYLSLKHKGRGNKQ